MSPFKKLAITINGEPRDIEIPVNTTLIDLINNDLGLIGAPRMAADKAFAALVRCSLMMYPSDPVWHWRFDSRERTLRR